MYRNYYTSRDALISLKNKAGGLVRKTGDENKFAVKKTALAALAEKA
jgi:hypothetical protein